jgi:hypothetical protein
MVQVKFKPQYLVFSMHSLITDHKTLDFCCGKSPEHSPATDLAPAWCKNRAKSRVKKRQSENGPKIALKAPEKLQPNLPKA